MGLIDIIKSILTFNKKPARIIVEDLTKTNGESTPLEIGLYSEDTPLTDKTLNIKINNVNYIRTTNENGIAKLNINLPIGEYDTHITFDDPDYHFVLTMNNGSKTELYFSREQNGYYYGFVKGIKKYFVLSEQPEHHMASLVHR